MRAIVAAVLLIFLVGCAGSTPKSADTPDSAEAYAGEIPDKETLKAYFVERGRQALTGACGPSYSLPVSDTCMRGALLAGFDATGDAAQQCSDDLAARDAWNCIVIGSLTREITERLTGHVEPFDWNDYRAAGERAFGEYAEGLKDTCGSHFKNVLDCVTRDLGDRLALADTVTAKCRALRDVEKAFSCQMWAYLTEYLDDGFARIEDGAGVPNLSTPI